MKCYSVLIFTALFLATNQFYCYSQMKNDKLNSVIKLSSALSKLEDRYANDPANTGYIDSIISINLALEHLVSAEAAKISAKQISKLKRKTELKIIQSSDSLITAISWTIFNQSPEPGYSNLLVRSPQTSELISNDTTLVYKPDINYVIDSIVTLKKHDSRLYLLVGTGSCGNLCLTNNISGYLIVKSKFAKQFGIFCNGNKCSDEIVNMYYINQNISQKFIILDSVVKAPVRGAENMSYENYYIK